MSDEKMSALSILIVMSGFVLIMLGSIFEKDYFYFMGMGLLAFMVLMMMIACVIVLMH